MNKTIKVMQFSIMGNESSDVDFVPIGMDGDKSLMMWKEILRTGIFYQPDGSRHIIDEDYLNHMVKTFNIRNAKGIKIPMPLGHTYDPEMNRGFVKYLEVRPSEGGKSIWAICEFIDAEAKENLKGSDVSISAPEELYDGDGVRYENSLEHVCFTDYPVVYGMEGFRDVKFDLTKGMSKENWKKIHDAKRAYCESLGFKPVNISFCLIRKEKGMNLKELLNKLGIDPEKLTSQEEAFQKIGDVFDSIEDKSDDETSKFSKKRRRFSEEDEDEDGVKCGKRMSKRRRFSEEDEDDEDSGKTMSKRRRFSEEDEDDEDSGKTMSKRRRFSEEDENENEDGGKTMSKRRRFSEEDEDEEETPSNASFSMRTILKENRQMKIRQLLSEGLITPEQAKDLRQEFCNSQNLQFSLTSMHYDEFEKRIGFLKKGISMSQYDDFTGPQIPGVRFSGSPQNTMEELYN